MSDDFEGTFGEHIERTRKRLEAQLREEAEGEPDDVAIAERAEAEAQFKEAHEWLLAKWGERFSCPVCRNVEWRVGPVFPTPAGFLGFSVTCRYCANTMSVVPAQADLEEPQLPDEQLPEK